jgi:peptidoglycan/LPS O-acetylase OafA/YrhL
MLPIDLALIIALASMSYYFVEQPIVRFAKVRSEMVAEGDEYWWRTEN